MVEKSETRRKRRRIGKKAGRHYVERRMEKRGQRGDRRDRKKERERRGDKGVVDL